MPTERHSVNVEKTRPAPLSPEIERGIQELCAEDYESRSRSVELLARHGEESARALVDVLLRKKGDPLLVSNFADALAEIGKPALPSLLAALEALPEIRRTEDVDLLETFTALLGHLNDRRAVPGLLRQVVKLQNAVRLCEDSDVRECCEAARIRLRQVLIDLGDRGGLDDLLSLLGDGRRRVPSALVDLLAKVGNREAVLPLARLHVLEEPVSYSGGQLIREAIRQIAHRERLSWDDPLLKKAGRAERTALERILPKPRP